MGGPNMWGSKSGPEHPCLSAGVRAVLITYSSIGVSVDDLSLVGHHAPGGLAIQNGKEAHGTDRADCMREDGGD